jgi:putative ABC transport system permease protein
MMTLKIALRNLSRQKKRSAFLIVAIAFGVLIVTVINGFAGAFLSNVTENVAQVAAGHIFVTGVERSEKGKNLMLIRDEAPIREALATSGIAYDHLTKRSELEQVSLSAGNRKAVQQVTGIDLESEKAFSSRLVVVAGSFDMLREYPDGIVITEKTAEKLVVGVGDKLQARTRTYSGQQTAAEFTVACVVKDPGLFGSLSAYANLAHVNDILFGSEPGLLESSPGLFTNFGIVLRSIDEIDPSAERLYAAMEADPRLPMMKRVGAASGGGNPFEQIMNQLESGAKDDAPIRYQLLTITDTLSQVKDIVAAINAVSIVILLILYVIIMVGINNTFRMIMMERVREIGTIRAVGMQRAEVLRMFLTEALLIAVIGTALGLVLAGFVMFGVSFIDLGLDNPIAFLLKNGHLSFTVQAGIAIVSILLIAGLTLLAALSPARKAANLPPAVALRTTK